MTKAAVETIDIAKNYGPVQALKPTSLKIMPGNYYVLLGPSGGGKTTTLRLIGGLIRPSQGKIFINGEDVTRKPPNKRNTSMVFQNYALFPHMSVAENVGYGLRLRKQANSEIARQVDEMLELVGLSGYQQRMPHELSGGQQQRVQLARSLVLHSDILLLDEPLAALDAKLRKSMCYELKRIQEQVGITFIHVTHNQEEAMTIADRIAVIAAGDLIEEGSARDIYEKPQRRFTADFIGENVVLDGTVQSSSGSQTEIDLGFTSVSARLNGHNVSSGQKVALSIRPEIARILPDNTPASGWQSIPATYIGQIYLGFSTASLVRFANNQEGLVKTLSGQAEHQHLVQPEQPVHFAWPTDEARLHID